MDERVKKLWTTALRSGEYEQGRDGYLRQVMLDGSYLDCCLGVLCDLFAKEQPDQGRWEEFPRGVNYRRFVTPSDSEVSFLPVEVKRWARLDSDNPVLWQDYKASELNDGEAYDENDKAIKATFTDIARMVEEYL